MGGRQQMTLGTHRYEEFVRQVVDELDRPEFPNGLTAEERVGCAHRLTDAFLDSEDGLDLTDESAMKLAALIAAMDQDMTDRGVNR
jgi:hypothetical protein